ncbi:hypothetical protein ACQUJO_07900 [Ralstonia pseudosolanacearum]
MYIYSFLDVRENNLGRNYLAQFEKIIDDELQKRKVRSKQLWFNKSGTALHTAMIDRATFTSLYVRKSTTEVPVKRTIAENMVDEASFGANYRLILFPRNISNETYNSYEIHLDIQDAITGRLLWYATMKGGNFNWVVQDEVPEQRARLAVQSIIEALDGSHLLPVAAPLGVVANSQTQAAPPTLNAASQGDGSVAPPGNDYDQMKIRYQDRLVRQQVHAVP